MIYEFAGSVWARIKANDKIHMAWCVSGIIGCLVVYGVLQASEAQPVSNL
jgi:hypothetical protein